MNVPDNYQYFFSGNSVKTMLLPLKKKTKKKQKQTNLFIQMTRKKNEKYVENMFGYFQPTQKPTIFLFHSSLKSGIKFCSYNIKKKVFIQSNCFVLDKIDTFAPINSCTHHLQKTRVNHTSDRTNTHVYCYTGKHVTQVIVNSEHM